MNTSRRYRPASTRQKERWSRLNEGGTIDKQFLAMIHKATGNLLKADAEALVNTVNCVGFMGKGIALQFKQAWPENFEAYAKACKAGEVRPGRMFIWETGRLVNPKYIINFPTKRDWRGKVAFSSGAS